MIKRTLLASTLLAVTSTPTLAEWSGNVSIATDYVFRGYSQTDNQIALQGGFDYSHESGFYLGTWASNIDSNFFSGKSTDPQLELDVYAGFSGETEGGVGYDFGILHYDYPGYSDSDTDEVYVSLSYADVSLSLNYSDELAFVGSSESAYYVAGGYEVALPSDFSLSVSVGYSGGDAFDGGSNAAFSDSYVDWAISIGKTVGGVDLALTYTDLSQESEDETNFCGDSEICEAKVVFSASKSL